MLGEDGIKLCINLDVPIDSSPATLVAPGLPGVRHDYKDPTSRRSRHVLELWCDVIQRTDDYPEAIRTD